MSEDKTTIVINTQTRQTLRHVGRKYQTYDDIIKELLEQKYGKGSLSSVKLREPKEAK
jgi:hypothetical protein